MFTSVYELVKEVTPGSPVTPPDDFDPDAPNTRYNASVPDLFLSTFSMPGFKGQFRAVQGGGVGVTWNAGQKLYDRVNNALLSCNEGGGGLAGECRFASLLDPDQPPHLHLVQQRCLPGVGGQPHRRHLAQHRRQPDGALAAPASIAPQDNTSIGLLDVALGLPATVDTDLTTATFNALQTAYGACAGSNLAAACSAALPARTQRARREARERILAYMAGAQIVPDNLGFPKRINAGANQGSTLYYRRDWVLADSTLATPAVVGPPIEPEPTTSGFEPEYVLFRDGFRDGNGLATGDGTRIGFGLRNPDLDAESSGRGHPRRPLAGTGSTLKPAMSVAYVAGPTHAARLPRRSELRGALPTPAPAATERGRRSCGASCPTTSSASSGNSS